MIIDSFGLPAQKEVLPSAFIFHTFPSLEYSSLLPYRDICFNYCSMSRPILALTPPRTINPSVMYFNARGKHIYGLYTLTPCDPLFPCSPSIRISQMDDGEFVISIKNYCFISHSGFRESSFSRILPLFSIRSRSLTGTDGSVGPLRDQLLEPTCYTG